MSDEKIISRAMAILGSRTSRAKKAACRENGKLGGWPKGKKRGKANLTPSASKKVLPK